MSYQIELKHLQSFLVLAEELHFRKAAEKLFLSQPGLSKQIQLLEGQLGIMLLERDRRNVRLTECGEYLKNQISHINGILDHTINHLKSIEAGIEGEVKIGFVGSAMQKVIPQLLKKSTTKHPDIHFTLDEMSNAVQVNAVQKYQIDLGFVRLKGVPADIHHKPIYKEHFSLVLPKDHAIGTENFERMSQFEKESFIMFSSDYSSTYYDNVMSIFDDAGFIPKVSNKSIHANTIFRLVESGLGVAIVPHSLTLGVAKSIDIQIIQLNEIRQRAILSIIWKKERHFPALEKILQFFEV